jgi:hypothetical protein
VIGFFAVGAALLALVNVEEGQRVARKVEVSLTAAVTAAASPPRSAR